MFFRPKSYCRKDQPPASASLINQAEPKVLKIRNYVKKLRSLFVVLRIISTLKRDTMNTLVDFFRPTNWKIKAIGYSKDKKKQAQRIKELISSRDSLKSKYKNLQNSFDELEKRYKEVSDALKKS